MQNIYCSQKSMRCTLQDYNTYCRINKNTSMCGSESKVGIRLALALDIRRVHWFAMSMPVIDLVIIIDVSIGMASRSLGDTSL